MAETDVELLQAWRAGDKGAGERLVERHFASLCRFFRGHVDEAISDLVQRTWVACVSKRDEIADQERFRAFLFGVAHRELLMFMRKRYRGERALVRVAADAPVQTSPSQALAAREQERLVHWAMRQIPAESRVIIQLLYWEELSIESIAEVLGVPAGTVKSRLHRARGQLRSTMESAGVDALLVETTMASLPELGAVPR